MDLILPWHVGTQDLLEQEQNDCSVRALANVEGCTYEQAHLAVARAGRVEETAMCFIKYARLLTSRGYKINSGCVTPLYL